MFLPHPRVKVSFVGSLRDREVACSASDRQGSNFESCVWRTVSSQSSHHPQVVLLAQFSLYVHKGGLKPALFLPTTNKHGRHETSNQSFYVSQPSAMWPTLRQNWLNVTEPMCVSFESCCGCHSSLVHLAYINTVTLAEWNRKIYKPCRGLNTEAKMTNKHHHVMQILSEHNMLIQGRYDAGPSSQTVAHRHLNVISTSSWVCWVNTNAHYVNFKSC